MYAIKKEHIILAIAVCLIWTAVVVTMIFISKESDANTNNNNKKKKEILTILTKDNEIERPNKKLNAKFELVQMENGMTGILISDSYASQFHIQFTMKYGEYIDTVPGISHFGEHMVLQSCEKYNYLYPIFNILFGIKDIDLNAMTSGSIQSYYIYLPFNFLYDKAMSILTESFRYPFYSPDLIIKEIQAVNHEFYLRMYPSIVGDIIRHLSSDKTSFHGMGCGNNQTLKPSESVSLSQKLKGYHMLIKSPDKIFFTLYSNKTLNEEEEIAKNYLNYKMHIFPDSEIDINDKKKLEENIKKIESIEIFDDNLYKHGIYYILIRTL